MPCLSRMAEGAKIIVYLQTKFLYIFYFDTYYYDIFYTKVRIYFVVFEIFTNFAHSIMGCRHIYSIATRIGTNL